MKAILTGVAVAALIFAVGAPLASASTPNAKRHTKTSLKTKKKLQKLGAMSGTRRGPRGARGPRGFTGDPGADGAQGAVGPQGAQGPAGGFTNAGVQYINGPLASVQYSPALVGSSTAVCPSGTRVLGGGWDLGTVFLPIIAVSKPVPDGSGWYVLAGSSYGNGTIRAVAVCA